MDSLVWVWLEIAALGLGFGAKDLGLRVLRVGGLGDRVWGLGLKG